MEKRSRPWHGQPLGPDTDLRLAEGKWAGSRPGAADTEQSLNVYLMDFMLGKVVSPGFPHSQFLMECQGGRLALPQRLNIVRRNGCWDPVNSAHSTELNKNSKFFLESHVV